MNNLNNTNKFVIVFIILGIIYSSSRLSYEKFTSSDLEPLLCYGWFFKIPIIFTTLKFCIPGLAIPMPSSYSSSASGRDCDGSDVCE